MKAVVLEKTKQIAIRDIEINEELGPDDVRIDIRRVGICGSDIHYYLHGVIGPYVVKEPMVLGHEASGIVTEVGSNVTDVRIGDKVCMEPGIPDSSSKVSRMGMYNLDPSVRFWATPPIHGVMRTSVVHPAAFTFRLPDSITLGEGALIEPLAIGMHAAHRASIKPGDIAVVTGAGTIGLVTVLAALAGGCSKVIVTDLIQPKLDIAAQFGSIVTVNIEKENPQEIISKETDGWGANIVFEASGNERACKQLFDYICPRGIVVYIGIPPVGTVPLDVVSAQAKEAKMETIFRYAHMFPRAIKLMGSGKIDVKPLLTDVYDFEESVEAFEYASDPNPESVKVQIEM